MQYLVFRWQTRFGPVCAWYLKIVSIRECLYECLCVCMCVCVRWVCACVLGVRTCVCACVCMRAYVCWVCVCVLSARARVCVPTPKLPPLTTGMIWTLNSIIKARQALQLLYSCCSRYGYSGYGLSTDAHQIYPIWVGHLHGMGGIKLPIQPNLH